MNREEIKALIQEWIHKPPGSRPLLEKVIAEQYRNALTCQWEGLKRDDLTRWLRENMCGMQDLTDSEQDELDNRVAAILDGTETSTVNPNRALPMAAFKPSEKHKKLRVGNGPMPTDEEIAAKVKIILDGLNAGKIEP